MTHKILYATLAFCLMAVSSCKRETLQQRMQREAVEYTKKNCPHNIDQVTVLDSISFSIPKNQYSYYYRILGSGASDLVSSQKDGFRKMLLDQIKNNTKMTTEKEAGVNFLYIYRNGDNGHEIFRILITKKDYKK